MSDTPVNPIYWSAERIISYGPDTIHELALKAAGTLNSYQVVLGRCLLAVHRTKLYEHFGCSGSAHYGTLVLGLSTQKARTLRWVANKLEALPLLSRAGEQGKVSWSKLREVVRKATAETEKFWLELCRLKTYRDIERLVRCTPEGAIPGDLPGDADREPAVTEVRLHLGLTAGAVVERGLQFYSLQHGRPVPLSEAVEMLFSQLLRKGEVSGLSSAPEELEDLVKSQKEARKDLLAAHLGRQPLVQEARELAKAMGVTTTDEDSCDGGDAALPIEEIYGELLQSSQRVMSAGTHARETGNAWSLEGDDSERPAREAGNVASSEGIHPEFPARGILTDRVHGETEDWGKILEAHQRPCPGNEDVVLLARDWRNHNLRFNPEARLATPAQRKELLRRDGYCCSTPGCPNHLWLELHHLVYYSNKGGTISMNLITLCSRAIRTCTTATYISLATPPMSWSSRMARGMICTDFTSWK